MRNQGTVNKNKRTGGPQQLTDSTIRSIAGKGREEKYTARMRLDELPVNVSVRRVQQILSDAQFSSMKSANLPRV